MKRSKAVDTWMRLEKHPNQTDVVRLIADAAASVLKQSDDGGFDAFIERLKAALDTDPDVPKSNVKFDALDEEGNKIDDPLGLLFAWNESGDPDRPCVKGRVLRLNEKTRKYKHAGYLTPQEIDIEVIATRFGGGTYRIELLDIDNRYLTAVSGVGIAEEYARFSR